MGNDAVFKRSCAMSTHSATILIGRVFGDRTMANFRIVAKPNTPAVLIRRITENHASAHNDVGSSSYSDSSAIIQSRVFLNDAVGYIQQSSAWRVAPDATAATVRLITLHR